jgi:hypothetical protein
VPHLSQLNMIKPPNVQIAVNIKRIKETVFILNDSILLGVI